MITGYHRDDVRPSCDVWAASGDGASQRNQHINHGVCKSAHDESSVFGDTARGYGVVKDHFCVS